MRFDKVSFAYGYNKPILDEVDFSVRQGSKMTLMGQNGAGKSTLFNLIMGTIEPDSGHIHRAGRITVAAARQTISQDQLGLTVREFFQSCFKEKIYDIDPRIDEALSIVNLAAPYDRNIKSFSGGQQARLLLASALIQNPDLLLLDEPTNNLDKEGIGHLTQFLIDYEKTCIVISHDANFLNAFTEGVLYLDVFTRKVERYVGNYFDLLAELVARIEKENKKNAQLEKRIQENKDKSNYFAHKGGQMRLLAKKMRSMAEEMEEAKVDVRREDKTIRAFVIPSQPGIGGEILSITSFPVVKNHKIVMRRASISLRKNRHLLLLDEPTNHINFRHLPVIASALNQYDGAMILVSHVPEFVRQIRIDETLDLEK